jgi:hypothetical protein
LGELGELLFGKFPCRLDDILLLRSQIKVQKISP